MHFDLAHALISAFVIFVVIIVMKQMGFEKGEKKWNWPMFFAVFIVIFILNILWPYSR